MTAPSRDNWTFVTGDDAQRRYLFTTDGTSLATLTGRTYRSKLRKTVADSTAYTFTCTVDTEAATVTLDMAAATTATITPGEYVFDLEQTDAEGLVQTIIAGKVTVLQDVTR